MSSTISTQQISAMILTYLVESHCLRERSWVPGHELVSQIATFVAVASEKQSMAVPAQAKVAYVETVNRFCGTIQIVIDQLLENNYIQMSEMDLPMISSRSMKIQYRANAEHPYVEHFAGHLGLALKYVSHPAYAVEGSLLETMKRMRIDEKNPLMPALVSAPEAEPAATGGAGAGAGAGSRKSQKAAGASLAPITHVFHCKSEDRDVWYSVYLHEGGRKSCSCPNYHYVRSKTSEPCKHILSLPSAFGGDDDYEKVEHLVASEHPPTKLFNGQMDTDLFTEETQFVGCFAYREIEDDS